MGINFVNELKIVRKNLKKLTYKRYLDSNYQKSPFICDNLDFKDNREKFKELSSFREFGICSTLFKIHSHQLGESKYNEVQKVRLLLLDLLIEAYEDIV